MSIAAAVEEKAHELGFNMVGITPAAPSPMLNAYFRWLDAGMHGEMGYMERPDRQARRRDLNVILPGVRSLVVVGLDYEGAWAYRDAPLQQMLIDPARGRIASYAWGLDYHDIMIPRLEMLAEWLHAESHQEITHRVYVDTGAVLERGHGYAAGIGFIGKNTMLIHPRRGSYFFLGEILTTLAFDIYDTPGRATMCGNCTRCLAACPTNAFPQPHVLDARRCISYLTIEHKGFIDRALRPLMGNWVFGCDICQDVCPFQRFAPKNQLTAKTPSSPRQEEWITKNAAPYLLDLLALNDESFKARFYGTPIYRIRRERLVRNACIAAGNWGHEEAIEPLAKLLHDASPLLRGHAVWALGKIIEPQRHSEVIEKMLRTLANRETDTNVRTEIAAALSAE
jgi:epoxyqueuosine reductase